MSTKTTFKRVALVAVASLGFGVLTSVAPASATAVVPTALSAGTSSPSRVGAASVTTITVTHPAAATAEFTAAVKVTAAPATSKAATDTNTATLGATIAVGGTTVTGSNVYAVGGANMAITNATSPALATNTSTSFDISFVADVAGTYTLLVSTGASSYAAGNASTVVTITTVGAPTKITLANIGGVVTTQSGAANGQLISVTLSDANGNPTVLTDFEGITVTSADATLAVDNAALAKNEDVDGEYLVHVYQAAAITTGTSILTFKGSGLLPATLTTSTTITKQATSAALTTDTVACTTAANCPGATGGAATDTAFAASVKAAPALTIGGVSSTTSAQYFPIFVTNALGYTYASFLTLAATTTAGTTTTIAYTPPAPSSLATSSVDFGDNVATFTYAAGAAHTVAVADVVSTVLSATGGTIKFTAKVTDQ